MFENLTTLWEERRLLVILVGMLAFLLICLCVVVASRFLLVLVPLAEIGQAGPTVEKEGMTPTLTLPATHATATLPLKLTPPELTPHPTPTSTRVFPPLKLAPSDTPTPTRMLPLLIFPTRPLLPTSPLTATPTNTPVILLLPSVSPTLPATPAPPRVTLAPVIITPLPPYTPVAPPTATPIPGTAARILIVEVNPKGPDEYILIRNEGNAPQDMAGWWLRADHAWRVFTFPPEFVIQPGGSVRIHSGPGALDNPPTELTWVREEIWDDAGDVARLYNATNNLLVEYYY
ncbi:MAG: lamin tail domain-containing protein [Anaerolineae bacterium]